MTASRAQQTQKEQPVIRLRVLETTDLHVHIMPHNYLTDTPNTDLGLAKTASLIRQARAGAPNCLLFDNGDFLQGTPLADWTVKETEGHDHPMIAAMNALDYDAVCIGNHEFNFGLDPLTNALEAARFPVTCANVALRLGKTPQTDDLVAPPWHILDRDVTDEDGNRHTLRVGVIGLAPPQIPVWDHFVLGDRIATRDAIEAATAHLPDLLAAGADIVIALCHSGIASRTHRPGRENVAVPLARLDGIDVILAGHTHRTFPDPNHFSNDAVDATQGRLYGKPAVQAGAFGSHLGQIDLDLRKTPEGWRIADHQTEVLSTKGMPPDPKIVAIAQSAHDDVLSRMRQPVAKSSGRLHNYFALAAPSHGLTLIADAMRAEAEAQVQGTPDADLPVIAAVQPHNLPRATQPDLGINAPAGDLVIRHVVELYPYPNALCLLRGTGRVLRAWLENATSGYNRLTPGRTDQALIDPQVPSYHSDILFGLRYTVDLGQPAGRRITSVTLRDGTPLAEDAKVIIATTTYRAGGSGGYGMACDCDVVHAGERTVLDVITAFLSQAGEVHPREERVFDFAPMPKTQAWFETATAAVDHLAQTSERRLIDLGQNAPGLHRVAIDLDR